MAGSTEQPRYPEEPHGPARHRHRLEDHQDRAHQRRRWQLGLRRLPAPSLETQGQSPLHHPHVHLEGRRPSGRGRRLRLGGPAHRGALRRALRAGGRRAQDRCPATHPRCRRHPRDGRRGHEARLPHRHARATHEHDLRGWHRRIHRYHGLAHGRANRGHADACERVYLHPPHRVALRGVRQIRRAPAHQRRRAQREHRDERARGGLHASRGGAVCGTPARGQGRAARRAVPLHADDAPRVLQGDGHPRDRRDHPRQRASLRGARGSSRERTHGAHRADRARGPHRPHRLLERREPAAPASPLRNAGGLQGVPTAPRAVHDSTREHIRPRRREPLHRHRRRLDHHEGRAHRRQRHLVRL